MKAAYMPIAEGPPGVGVIIERLNALKTHYGALPAMRAAALAIAGTGLDNDQAAHVERLAAFVMRAVVYVLDPFNAEYVQSPPRLLLEINAKGTASGDCDDCALLFCSLCEALGVPAEIIGANAAGEPAGPIDHVVARCYPHGVERTIDLCARG